MDRREQPIKPYCLHWKNGWKKLREYGLKSCSASYGPTKPHPDDRQGTLLLPSHTGWMQSSPRKLACPQPGLQFRDKEMKMRNLQDAWTGWMRQEKQPPFGWPPISKSQLRITIERCDLVFLKNELLFLEKFLKIQPKQEPKSSKPIGKDPILCQKQTKMGPIICKH